MLNSLLRMTYRQKIESKGGHASSFSQNIANKNILNNNNN